MNRAPIAQLWSPAGRTARFCKRYWSSGADHAVVSGDSTNAQTYRHQLFAKKASILITDPPYCLLERKRSNGDDRELKSGRKLKTEGRNEVPRFRSLKHYREFSQLWLTTALSNGLQKDSWLIIWTNLLGRAVLIDVCASLQYCLQGEHIWAKSSSPLDQEAQLSQRSLTQRNLHPVAGRNSEVMLRVYESALVFAPQAQNVDPATGLISVRGRPPIPRESIPWAIATAYHDSKQSDGSHPCRKPLAAVLPLVLTWTQANDRVLDPFAGSGAIGNAVMNASRLRPNEPCEYVGIEILQEWSGAASNQS